MNNLDLEVIEFIKNGADFGFVLTGLGEIGTYQQMK